LLKLNIGVNRKVQGEEPYSSKGFSCNLEVELADGLLNDAQALRAKVEELFAEARHAVEAQINGGPAGQADRGSSRPPASPPGGDGDPPATNKQIQYLLSLGRRNHGMSLQELQDYCNRAVGQGDIYSLTRTQCSRVIDALKGGDGNGGRH